MASAHPGWQGGSLLSADHQMEREALEPSRFTASRNGLEQCCQRNHVEASLSFRFVSVDLLLKFR